MEIGIIGIVIVGVGRWGVHLVRNFNADPLAKILAIVDSDRSCLDYCHQELLHNNPNIILTTHWQLVRQLEEITAVVIATPASTHYTLIKDALNLGYHVWAEKPLTLDPKQCLELTHLADKQQRQLFVDHTYLFNPAVEKGKEIVQQETLGELRYGYASRTHLGPVRQDVDALWDLAIHDLSIFNYWLGVSPIEVSAKRNSWLQPGLADLVWVTLTYPNKIEIFLHFCWCNPDKQRKLCLVGNKGSLIFDEMSDLSPLTLQHGYLEQEGAGFVPQGNKEERIQFVAGEPLKNGCDRFLANIRSQNYSFFSDGSVGTELVKILSCLTLSLELEGQKIRV